MIKHGRNVRRDEVFVLPKSNNDWWSLPDGHDLFGLIRRHDRQRVNSAQICNGPSNASLERRLAFVKILLDQMGDHFSICLGDKGMVFGLKLSF